MGLSISSSGYCPYPVVDLKQFGFVRRVGNTPLGSVAYYTSSSDAKVDKVFLHGVGLDSRSWTPLLAAAQAGGLQTDNWALIDLPGFGATPLPRSPYSIDDIALSLEALLRKMTTKEVTLVGHSMGGFLALHLGSRNHPQIKSVTSICGSYESIVRAVNQPVKSIVLSPRVAASYGCLSLLARSGSIGEAIARHGAQTRILRLALFGLVAHPLRLDSSVIDAIGADLRSTALMRAEATGVGYQCSDVWAKISCPVHAIYASTDSFVTRRDQLTAEQVVSQCTSSTVADAGHLLPLERPIDLLELL